MANLVIITQRVDEADDILGFFVDWIREFAKHYSNVSVITLASGRYNLPANVKVYSLGKERGRSKIFWPFILYWRLFQLVPKSDGIFAHMSPLFAISAWPVAFVFNKRIILWYLHKSVTARLKLANILSSRIVTANRDSLYLKSQKIVEVGHGIDIEKFQCIRNWDNKEINILSVGRISPIKNYETLISAVSQIDYPSLKISIIGRPFYSHDDEYEARLKRMVNDLNLGDRVKFSGFISHNEIAPYYCQAQICVGLTPKGGIDKVILEAMAADCLVLTSNSVMAKYLGDYAGQLTFNHDDASHLKERLENLFALPAIEKEKISRYLRESVQKYHSLSNCVNRITSLFK